MKIKTKGLSIGSIFKLNFIGYAGFAILAYIITVINSFIFPGDPAAPGIKINGVPATDPENWWALLIALPFITVICGGLMGLVVFIGQWLYTRFRPITFEFNESKDQENNT